MAVKAAVMPMDAVVIYVQPPLRRPVWRDGGVARYLLADVSGAWLDRQKRYAVPVVNVRD
jgi:hypothetical protein